MKLFGKTDIGLVRSINQDTFAYGTLCETSYFCLVCDGMGGENAGNIASEIAKNTIAQRLEAGFHPTMDHNAIKNLMTTAINFANLKVYDEAKKNPDYLGMGTTIVLSIIHENIVHIAHIGDSRAYLYYNNRLDQITCDHSMVQQLIDDGKITSSQALMHPQKNVITRAVGVEKQVDCDYVEFALPTVATLVLCSDGLSNYCEPNLLSELLAGSITDMEATCDQLIKEACASGGYDNITVILATTQ